MIPQMFLRIGSDRKRLLQRRFFVLQHDPVTLSHALALSHASAPSRASPWNHMIILDNTLSQSHVPNVAPDQSHAQVPKDALRAALRVLTSKRPAVRDCLLVVYAAPELWTFVEFVMCTSKNVDRVAVPCAKLVLQRHGWTGSPPKSPALPLARICFQAHDGTTVSMSAPQDVSTERLLLEIKAGRHAQLSEERWRRSFVYSAHAGRLVEALAPVCLARNFNGHKFEGSMLLDDDMERPVLFPCGCALDESDILSWAESEGWWGEEVFKCFLCTKQTGVLVLSDRLLFEHCSILRPRAIPDAWPLLWDDSLPEIISTQEYTPEDILVPQSLLEDFLPQSLTPLNPWEGHLPPMLREPQSLFPIWARDSGFMTPARATPRIEPID